MLFSCHIFFGWRWVTTCCLAARRSWLRAVGAHLMSRVCLCSDAWACLQGFIWPSALLTNSSINHEDTGCFWVGRRRCRRMMRRWRRGGGREGRGGCGGACGGDIGGVGGGERRGGGCAGRGAEMELKRWVEKIIEEPSGGKQAATAPPVSSRAS